MSNLREQRIFFLGNESRPLDDKRRLTVPSRWRPKDADIANEFFAIPNPKNKSILVYPPEMKDKLFDKISEIGMSGETDEDILLMEIFGNGEYMNCDKQGRISLSESLMKHAGISKEAKLIGRMTLFQIWDPCEFEAYKATKKSTDPSETLKKLGL